MAIEIVETAFGSDLYMRLLILRRDILRTPLNLPLSEGDTRLDSREFHLAALVDGDVVGCVLLRPLESGSIKLRQMAVVASHRGRGIGAQLVRAAEELAVKRGFTRMEMHARRTAQTFYEKLGYAIEGDEFLEITEPHIKMAKALVTA